jgi:hypothetical protein
MGTQGGFSVPTFLAAVSITRDSLRQIVADVFRKKASKEAKAVLRFNQCRPLGATTMRRCLLVVTIISFAGWSQPPLQRADSPIVVRVEMPPTPRKGVLDYLQEFGPLIAACVAVGVGLMQWHLQRRHLKQNLFEKRWKVYTAVQEYLAAILREEESDPYRQFRRDTDPGELLFSHAVWEHVNAVGEAGGRFRAARSKVQLHGTIAHASAAPGNLEDEQWRNEAFSKLQEAQCQEEELRRLLSKAFESRTKAVFLKELRPC